MNIRSISKISGFVVAFALLSFSIAPVTTQAAGITILGERCVNNDGVVEVAFPSDIESFELDGPDSDSGGNPDAKTFSGLEDGNYTLTAYTGSGGATATFTVDCDPDTPDPDPEPEVKIIDQRCANNDGVIEFSFENVDSFELNGPDSDSGGGPDAKTFSGLADGNYTLSVSNNSNNSESVSFKIDCDPDPTPDPDLDGICFANPNNAKVGETVKWGVDQISGGTGSYSYSWSGAVTGSGANHNKSFSSPGTYTATLTVTSGGQSVEVDDCTVEVTKDSEPEPETCDPDPETDLRQTSFNADTGTVVIKNNSDKCDYKVGVASYKGFSLNPSDPGLLAINDQKLFDYKTTQVKAGEKVTLDIKLPSCAYQMDSFYGDVITSFANGDRYGERLLGGAHKNVSNLCGEKEPDPIIGNCTATPNSVKVGQTVQWEATASGGVGNFSYQWSGAVTGSGSQKSKSFAKTGTKTATVQITSGTETITKTCSVEVTKKPTTPGPEINLKAKSCVAGAGTAEIRTTSGLDSYKLINTSTGNTVVNDTDGASKGVISFDNLPDGNYRFEGKLNGKTASVTFSIDCDNGGSELSGECVVSDNKVGLGDDVTFTANASGGQSPYSYSWNLEGSDDDANTKSVETEYKQTGTYNGTVTITDDAGDQIMRTCSVKVEVNDDDDDDDNGGGGGDRLDPRDKDVRGDRDVNFGVQCLPEKSIYNVGEVVLFEATIDNDDVDIDDVDFDWSGAANINETGETATVQFSTGGVKEIRVSAEYDGETETDNCYVQIGRGVSLDEVPYTGPGGLAKTLAFITTILLLALGGGYAIIKRREGEGIPVGIPNKHN